MRVIIGGVYYPTIDGSSVQITRAVSDPVPTCTVNIQDANSTLKPLCAQEILIIDDQQVPNPTINMLLNPALNPYTSSWTTFTPTGATLATVGGGGVQITVSTTSVVASNNPVLQQALQAGSIVPGQSYVFSITTQGSSSPTNIGAFFQVFWQTASGITISSPTTIGTVPVSTSPVRLSETVTAPAGASFATISTGVRYASGTNSGVLTLTQPQFEPAWFPTLSYPTPWCGPSQTNCQQLPLGFYIRQYRKFGGLVTHITAQDYHGNVRTLVVTGSGYAWLANMSIGPDTFSSRTDAQIITTLTNKYLLSISNGTALCTLTNAITGVTLSSTQLNWDDLRTVFDGLASQSGYYWTIDYYWNFIYAPPGYLSMPISLICDDSATPDMVSTFPAYNFSAEQDYTQPGANVLVIGGTSGGTTFTAEVIDPSQVAALGLISGYFLPATTSWMRKVNDSNLLSNTDCTNRGIAEMIQYDKTRNIYHLTTNVELVPGEGIAITSATEGLSASVQLIQQTQAQWLGTDETLTDVWEYQSDLGAANRAATSIISRIFRSTNTNSSAPAINVTTLALFETIGIVDSASTAATTTSYVGTVQGDSPVGYYRLSNQEGTVADDWSGNGNKGTIVNSPTLAVATLLTDAAAADTSDFAITFAAASSQQINLPTSMAPTGAHAWSLECWFKVTAVPPSGSHQTLMGWGAASGAQKFGVLNFASNGTTFQVVLSTNSGDITSGNLSTSTIYHVVGTYDGTSTRLYVNGSLVAGPTTFALSLTQTLCCIGAYSPGAYSNSFFSGTIDEVAFYTTALSTGQVSAHYTAGT